MQAFQTVTHDFRILQVWQSGVNFHHLESDGLCGIADLLNGFGACHESGMFSFQMTSATQL
jgi:hypothetical protein